MIIQVFRERLIKQLTNDIRIIIFRNIYKQSETNRYNNYMKFIELINKELK